MLPFLISGIGQKSDYSFSKLRSDLRYPHPGLEGIKGLTFGRLIPDVK